MTPVDTLVTSLDGLGTRFRQEGYLVIEDFLSREDCQRLLNAVDAYRRDRGLIEVNSSSITATRRFLTFNGEDVEENIPGITEISVRVIRVRQSSCAQAICSARQ